MSAPVKVYIAGKITGSAGHFDFFRMAESFAKKKFPGASIMNPATLPSGMLPADYMSICLPMVLAADVVVFLPDWKDSVGARIEHALAEYTGKAIIETTEE